MNRLTLLIVLLFTYTACSSGSQVSDDIKWSIISEIPDIKNNKNTVNVKLNKKTTKKEIEILAKEIRSSRKKFGKLWVFYRLSDNTNEFAWAYSHFTPDLEVKIQGSTEEQDKLTASPLDIEGEIIGKWRCEKSLMGGTIIIYINQNDQLTERITFKDGSNRDKDISKAKENTKLKYFTNNSHGEYYLLESNGNLGLYDGDGKFDEAVKLDND